MCVSIRDPPQQKKRRIFILWLSFWFACETTPKSVPSNTQQHGHFSESHASQRTCMGHARIAYYKGREKCQSTSKGVMGGVRRPAHLQRCCIQYALKGIMTPPLCCLTSPPLVQCLKLGACFFLVPKASLTKAPPGGRFGRPKPLQRVPAAGGARPESNRIARSSGLNLFVRSPRTFCKLPKATDHSRVGRVQPLVYGVSQYSLFHPS